MLSDEVFLSCVILEVLRFLEKRISMEVYVYIILFLLIAGIVFFSNINRRKVKDSVRVLLLTSLLGIGLLLQLLVVSKITKGVTLWLIEPFLGIHYIENDKILWARIVEGIFSISEIGLEETIGIIISILGIVLVYVFTRKFPKKNRVETLGYAVIAFIIDIFIRLLVSPNSHDFLLIGIGISKAIIIDVKDIFYFSAIVSYLLIAIPELATKLLVKDKHK